MDKQKIKSHQEETKLYQGIAIIDNPDYGPAIIYYRDHAKPAFDLDVKKGVRPGGKHKILIHQWQEKPVNLQGIEEIATGLFDNSDLVQQKLREFRQEMDSQQ